MVTNEHDTRAVRLPPNHEKVQYLTRRYMYCVWRAERATNEGIADIWWASASNYDHAISNLIGTRLWRVTGADDAQRILRDKLPAIPKREVG